MDCPCKKTRCPRHGNCEECRRHHFAKGNMPKCDRIKLKEAKTE